jgi:hypothetical protein
MTGHAPLAEVYRFADRIFQPESMGTYITRPRYATLAEMARNAGDLSFSKVGKRGTRLRALEKYGLVRRPLNLHRWELTAAGWNLLNASEDAWRLSSNQAGWRGASAGRDAASFDERELAMGVKAEAKEHGVPAATARRIAMDHLVEDPRYYSKERAKEHAAAAAVPTSRFIESLRSKNRIVPRAKRRFPPSEYFTAVAMDTGGTAHRAYQGPSLSTARVKAKIAASQWRMPVTVVDQQWNEIATYQPGDANHAVEKRMRADGWVYLGGLTDKSFPIGSNRYQVTSIDRSQSPAFTDHGGVGSFDTAKNVADRILREADRVEIWDSKRGHMVAYKEQ